MEVGAVECKNDEEKRNTNEKPEKPELSVEMTKQEMLNAYTTEAQHQQKFTRDLMITEYVSIIFTAFSIFIYAIFAYEDDSVSAFAFSIDSFLDLLAYLVIIWRFWDGSKNGVNNSSGRDRVALLILGLFFVISSFAVAYESTNNLYYTIKPQPSFFFIIIGTIECAAFGVIAFVKFKIAFQLNKNKTVISDGVNSIIASFSSLSMTIGMTVFVLEPNIWYLDAIFGAVMGSFVLLYGLKLLYIVAFNKQIEQ